MSQVIEKKHVRGFITVELLFALVITTLALSGAAVVAFGGQTASLDVNLTSGGISKSLQKMEETMALASAYVGWNALGNPSPEVVDNYTITQKSENTTPCMKRVEVGTNWDSEANRHQNVDLITLRGSIQEAIAQGGCDPSTPPPGGWDYPGSAGFVDANPGGIQGLAIDVLHKGGFRYAVIGSYKSPASTEDIWIFDVTDPHTMSGTPVSKIDVNNRLGVSKLVAVGNYIYALVYDEQVPAMQPFKPEQLVTIDILDILNPVVVDTVDLTADLPPASNLTLNNDDEETTTIIYYDEKLYLGFKNIQGPEFMVFETNSDPAHPQFVGAIDKTFNRNINDIAIHNNYAFLATSDEELQVLDISDVSAFSGLLPTQVFDAPGGEDATALTVLGDRLYLGREGANLSSHKDFYIFNLSGYNISDPTNLPVIGSMNNDDDCSYQPTCGMSSGSEVVEIVVRGSYAFLATSENTTEFQVWDVSDPATIRQMTRCGSYNYSEEPKGMVYDDNFIFMTNKDQKILRIIYGQPASCPL